MSTPNIRTSSTLKTLIISGAVVVAGSVTISAGDSYFEISKNLEIFTELYKELNIYYVDDTQPGN
jgi:carboxyl-terminal processing protease